MFEEKPFRFAEPVARSNRLALSLGANFSLVGVAAGLVLMLVVPQVGANPEQEQQAQGAAALDQGGSANAEAPPGSVASLASIDWFTPQATQATESVPSAYAEGCQQNQTDAEVVMCEYGDLDSHTVVAVVGDSKVLQWQSAIEQIANDQGWHVQSYTKSSCGFHTGVQVRQDAPYTSCQEWNENVLADLIELDHDAVLVSSGSSRALEDPTDAETGSNEAMIQALTEQWTTVTEAGSRVVVIDDNPNPGSDVYECVADHLDDLQACTFDREDGIQRSAASGQRAAAEQVPGVQTIDMTDQICPADTCVPVLGNVLSYRRGSHITDTYVRTLTPDLADKLIPAVERVGEGV